MSIMDEKSPVPIGIPTGVYMWLSCKKCTKTTRHIILNPDDCQDKAIYSCFLCSNEFVLCKEFYQLFYGCVIDDNDMRMAYQ